MTRLTLIIDCTNEHYTASDIAADMVNHMRRYTQGDGVTLTVKMEEVSDGLRLEASC